MSSTENKTVFEKARNANCSVVFQAVCDELGKYYIEKGFKYSASRPKITFQDDWFKLEINFWSSKSNIPGEYVCLEILPYFYSKHLIKTLKTKGLLFGHTSLFYKKTNNDPNKVTIQQIFGGEIERIEKNNKESLIIQNHTCNVSGINEEKFNKIIEFIDSKILVWIDKLKTEKGLLEFLADIPKSTKNDLLGKNTNSEFIDFVKFNFPTSNILGLLKG
jgi:hypothetical protein